MVKQTIKPKKAILRSDATVGRIYSVTCPHCHTTLRGMGLDENVLMLRCWQCKNIIDLRNDEKEKQRVKEEKDNSETKSDLDNFAHSRTLTKFN
jgi:endogenous inhibitor of DNA gyrase (YacG/DUF329 family)